MALFRKKREREEIPKLPELPRLPELPEFPETEKYSEELPQLPSFPNGSLGNKFSQNIIKEAVAGEKEEEGVGANEFAEEEGEGMRRMQRPLVREEGKKEFYPKIEQRIREAEPIFVRMDKFEEGSQAFEEVKRKVTEIEKMFDDIKRVKEKEDKELEFWEEEIKSVKEKIEKIDKNIFSKIE